MHSKYTSSYSISRKEVTVRIRTHSNNGEWFFLDKNCSLVGSDWYVTQIPPIYCGFFPENKHTSSRRELERREGNSPNGYLSLMLAIFLALLMLARDRAPPIFPLLCSFQRANFSILKAVIVLSRVKQVQDIVEQMAELILRIFNQIAALNFILAKQSITS